VQENNASIVQFVVLEKSGNALVCSYGPAAVATALTETPCQCCLKTMNYRAHPGVDKAGQAIVSDRLNQKHSASLYNTARTKTPAEEML